MRKIRLNTYIFLIMNMLLVGQMPNQQHNTINLNAPIIQINKEVSRIK